MNFFKRNWKRVKETLFKKSYAALVAIGICLYYAARPFKTQIPEIKLSYFLLGLGKNMISEVIVVGPKLLFRGVHSDTWYQTNASMLSKDRTYKLLKNNPNLVFSSDGGDDLKKAHSILNMMIIGTSSLLGYLMYNLYWSTENLSTGSHMRQNFKSEITFDDVHGLNYAKSELKEIIDFMKYPEKYQKIGARLRRGVLLHGPPGTGKTLLAKATAGESNTNFLFCTASDFVEMYVGMGAKRVRQLFEKARSLSPCIIFIDEIDGMGARRSNISSEQAGSDMERTTTLNQLLTEMDGFRENENIVVIAATNRILLLDDALIRSGRFDTKIKLELPKKDERVGIMKIHLRKKQHQVTEDGLLKVADMTPNFSGADLENLINESAYLAINNNRELILNEDVFESGSKINNQKNMKIQNDLS